MTEEIKSTQEELVEENTPKEKKENLFDRAKRNIAKALDQNDDGTLDLNDVAVFAGNVGNAAKKAAEAVKKNAIESNEQWNAKMEEAKREKELKTLQPIFPDDLDAAEFYISKLIRICEMDKKHAESELCKGSIGHVSDQKELSVVNIYRDRIDEYGLSFYPDKESEIYYVDPCDRDHYIALDEYFNYMKVARVSELQKIAQDLGAKHFRVTYLEQKKSFTNKAGKANLQGKIAKAGGSIQAENDASQSSFTNVTIEAESDYIGHAPVQPALKYLQREYHIQSLIAQRMSENQMTHQKFVLNLAASSGIKKNDAAKIDAALNSMKISGNASVSEEVRNEERRQLEYEIDF